jgi:hypothetical protein
MHLGLEVTKGEAPLTYTNNGTYHDVALAGSLATDPPGLRGRVSLVFVIHSGGNEPPIFAALTL